MIKFATGDLFTAPKGSYLVHACNCVGKWGSGIAVDFKRRFPRAHQSYVAYCAGYDPTPGDVLVLAEEKGYRVVCLFTSYDYSDRRDSPNKILAATKRALMRLPTDAPIHMPLINSGRFGVPWEHTAALLGPYDDMDITIWSLK